MPIDLNQSPYFDDFDEAKKYLKMLFVPGQAVQVRELNQLQTILNNQRERFGNHIFEDGAMVLPGHVSYDLNYAYIKVVSNSDLEQESYREANFMNKFVTGTSGVKAQIVNHLGPNVDDHVTFFVKYVKSSTAGTTGTFSNSETITVDNTAITAVLISSASTGLGSAANVDSGIYYARGYFIRVDRQTVILDAYSNTPSYRVGLVYTESLVEPGDDLSLYDNAAGTPNESAPGAHRYKADLILTKLELDTAGDAESEGFYELLKISNGQVDRIVETTDYSELEKTFARRTYDESGDYTVRPFHIKVRDHASDDTKLTIDIEPGKAYVRGYEILKVGKTSVDIDKAREYAHANNATITTEFGNYIRVNNLSGVPDITTYSKVNLYDRRISSDQSAPTGSGGASIGTARVRDIRHESGTYGSDAAVYKVYLFDIDITSTTKSFSDARSLVDTTNKFTCDIVLETVFPSEFGKTQTLTISTLAVTGNNTLWLTDPNPLFQLADNDYIAINGALYEVNGTPSSNTAFNITSSPGNGTYVFAYVYAPLYEVGRNTLVFPMPEKFVRKIKSSDDTTVDTNYTVRREFTGLTSSGGAVSISTGDVNEQFVSFSQDDYIVVYDTDNGQGGGVGAVINVNADYFSALPNSSLTIGNIGHPLENGETVRVIATVRKLQGSVSTQKTKTLVTGAAVSSTANERDLNEVLLGKADIYRLVAVYMKDGDYATAPTGAGDGIDVTSRYRLDNGQRDNYYDVGRIILNPGEKTPTGRLRIEFEYFTHSGGGKYFSVDSYVGAVDYEDIPSYASPDTGWVYELRDCLDFRPRINDAGSAFDNTTGSLTEFPIDGFVSADFSYYLNRIDKLYLDYRGNFHVVKGIDGLNPPAPEDPTEDGMVTHQLNVRAYTLDSSAVVIDYRDNKRYTMRDIGKLETRIANLEYYTSLSLLEKETQDLEIKDENGLDRFKNGIIVDPFNGHGIGDVQNPDYQCAIDMVAGIMRPIFTEDNVALEFNEDDSSDFQQTGDIITVPWEHEILVSQPLASNPMNVNPFNVLTFLGRVDLDPPQDEWKDTERAPDLIVNHEGNFDSVSQMANGMGTIWNEWQDTWSGVTSSNTETLAEMTFLSAEPVLHRNLDGTVDTTSTIAGWSSRPGIDTWPVRQVAITRTTNTVDTRQTRSGLRARVVPKVITENLGDKVINVAYIPYIRSRDVVFNAYGLKPNTRVYPFFDKVAVTANVSPGATYTSPGGALITDATGKVTGTFRIPAGTYLTGQRVFRLTSSSTDDANWSTAGNATYRAQGLLETKQSTILSTRNAEVAWESVNQDRVVTDTTVDLNVTDTNWIDPLAQTFLVTTDGGCFLSKLELYFRTKDANIPVILQIREVVNGYPGQKIVPFGEVIVDAANVHTNAITNGSLVVDGGAPDASFGPEDFVPTVFTFTRGLPYLKQGTEYCFVVMANSNSYELWTATFGINPETQIAYTIVGSDIPVQAQPYGGSLFKSQNASTWTAVQEADIMFKLYRADFDTSAPADLYFENATLPSRTLVSNPLQFSQGSELIRVYHPSHGMPTGSKVTISGAANASGILASRINTTHTIQNVELDSYVIDLASVTLTGLSSSGTALTGGTNFLSTLIVGSGVMDSDGDVRTITAITDNTAATLSSAFTSPLSSESVTVVAGATGTYGGSAVVATQNVQMDLCQPIVGKMDFPDTTSEFYLKTTSGKAVDGSQTPYVIDTVFSPVIPNENVSFSSPRLIASARNEQADVMVSGASKSFIMRALLSTTNSNISPVIDLKRLSVVTIANRLDSPSLTRNVNPLDYTTLVSANTNVAFTSGTSTISTADTATARNMSRARVGRYITVTGASNGGNNSTFRVVSVTYTGTACSIVVSGTLTTEAATAAVTIKHLERYISEYAPQYGSSASSYVCRRVQFAQITNSLRIQIAANRPPSSTIDVYYKVAKIDDTRPFDEIPYSLASVDIDPGFSVNEADFRDYTYTVNNIGDYVALAVKIVLSGTDTTRVPRITDFRAIGLAT